ncbi:hypothetical protein [uncultured Thiodictyon sp.]|uniref:hypothetical protein n=1 Tax=uncultured Thiodictyon sp. TaxID=1846217 RepID=UPI0025CD6B4D|nr:hypothetical protein [uncultured Thiodictyon sp.]
MRNIKAGLTYFALVFGAGFVLGAIRVPFLVPRLGIRIAELTEMPLMLVVIVLAARFIVKRFALPPGLWARLAAGAIALSLLVAAEWSLTVVLAHQSIADYIASRDPVSGSVYLAMLVLFALMPLILVRVRSTR